MDGFVLSNVHEDANLTIIIHFEMQISQKYVIQVPVATPEIVALLTSGLTASISLEEVTPFPSRVVILDLAYFLDSCLTL